MERASRQHERAVHVISLSELPLVVKKESQVLDDLPTLFSKLRRILLQKSASSDEIDSTTLQYIESIKKKINELESFSEPKEMFDTTQKTMEIYIRDLLSITQCPKILSSESFQEIFACLIRAEETVDSTTIFLFDRDHAQTTFNRSFEMLSLPVLQAFLNDKCSRELFNHLASIALNIITWIEAAMSFISFKQHDLEIYVANLRLLIEYVDRNKQNTDQEDIINDILITVCNLADNTILVPTLLKANVAPYFVKWISLPDFSLGTQNHCIHVLHNLARHDQGAKALNDVDCISVLKDFKRRILDPNRSVEEEPYVELRLLYCMVFSLVTEPKEDQQDLTDLKKVLNRLMGLVVDAGQSGAKMSGGFDLSEPLVVLTKLCLNDEILDYIVKECSIKTMQAKSIIDFFCELLLQFRGALRTENNLDQLTLIALFNMIWSISFHDEYVDELKSNSKFLMTVKTLANDDGTDQIEQYVPRYMLSITKAANGILWNLDEDNPARTTRTTEISEPTAELPPVTVDGIKKKEKTNDRMRVMVSYSHADKEFCHQLVNALQKDNRFEIWVDFAYCHTDDLWEEIGEAIEKADLVLFIMSKDYQDSKSCRQEVMYTKDSLKKRFIPIYIKKDFVATGWLGVRIVGPQYVRFGKRPFDETVKELLKIIADDGKQQKTEEPKPAPPPSPVPEKKPVEENKNLTEPTKGDQPIESALKPPNKPVETWTRKDITQWFDQHHVPQELINIYDFRRGTELLLYGQCLRPDWQIEYTDMRIRYEQKYNTPLYRDQFVRLVSAINTLRPSPVHSKTCIIT